MDSPTVNGYSVSGLVSVIIPVFNSEQYINKTIDSVLGQTYRHVEIIVVNDGSTDKTGELIRSYKEDSIICIEQKNKGVSAARNLGFRAAKGEFVIFFDSDDIMQPEFVSARVEALSEFTFFDFVCGHIRKIDEKGVFIDKLFKAACIDIEKEILTFRSDVITCPSNYMFRRDAMLKKQMNFNEALASSADRFFLLDVSKHFKGLMLRSEQSQLHYRYRANSMSNRLTYHLIKDNELFFELIINKIKPEGVLRRVFLSKSKYILAGAYFRIGYLGKSFKFAVASFLYHPLNFFRTIFKIKTMYIP
jgi:glycosyltransferase involved in cell wall biosynthesis